MTRSQLIVRLAEASGLGQKYSELAAEALLEYISDTLLTGNRFEIRHFGMLETTQLRTRQGYNPRTGKTVQLRPSRRVRFRTAKALLDRMNSPAE